MTRFTQLKKFSSYLAFQRFRGRQTASHRFPLQAVFDLTQGFFRVPAQLLQYKED